MPLIPRPQTSVHSLTSVSNSLAFFTIMKFISTAAALLAATVSVSAKALDVWAPKVLSPKAGDVWTSGQTQTVTWYA